MSLWETDMATRHGPVPLFSSYSYYSSIWCLYLLPSQQMRLEHYQIQMLLDKDGPPRLIRSEEKVSVSSFNFSQQNQSGVWVTWQSVWVTPGPALTLSSNTFRWLLTLFAVKQFTFLLTAQSQSLYFATGSLWTHIHILLQNSGIKCSFILNVT